MSPAAQPSQSKVNLFGLDREGLRAQFAAWDEKPFRAEQVMQWIYGRGVADFAAMTTLSKALRAKLAELAEVRTPELVTEQTSADGTRKWVLRLAGDPSTGSGQAQAVETVFIPQQDRGTLCISSQVGCAMDCSFCSTGKQGFSRNMNVAEIVAQVWFASRALGAGVGPANRAISNVVFMGMGEPLANFDALVPAVRILLDDFGFGLSKRRVTVSTSGLVPFMDRLHEAVDVALAVSLHAPNDALRDELVPINRKYPLKDLMSACNRYLQGKTGHAHILYEYVMLDGVNDYEEHARQLAVLLRGRPAKVNLIPFNPFPNTEYRRSKPERVRRFQEILMAKQILTTVRRTRGDDIDAACGQLVGNVQSRQKRTLRGIPIEARV